MFSARLRRVTLHGCKLNSVNLRMAALTEVQFVDCVLQDVDLGGAELTEVAFPGSRLDRVRLAGARLTDVDLTGASSLEIADGIDGITALRGAAITYGQLMELASLFALAAGVKIRD